MEGSTPKHSFHVKGKYHIQWVYTQNIFYKPITSSNPFEACFSNKKYTVLIQTRFTQIENKVFLEKNSLRIFL